MALNIRTAAFLLNFVFLALRTASAQEDSLEASPVNVTTQFSFGLGPECNGRNGLIVQFHYSGAQPMRGYLVF